MLVRGTKDKEPAMAEALRIAFIGIDIDKNLFLGVGLNVLPPNFELSFDNFRTVRKCRLIWRRGDFIGIAFEN